MTKVGIKYQGKGENMSRVEIKNQEKRRRI